MSVVCSVAASVAVIVTERVTVLPDAGRAEMLGLRPRKCKRARRPKRLKAFDKRRRGYGR